MQLPVFAAHAGKKQSCLKRFCFLEKLFFLFYRTPIEKAIESAVSSPPQFLSELQPGFEILRDNKNVVQRDVPKRVENIPAVGNRRNLECIQVVLLFLTIQTLK